MTDYIVANEATREIVKTGSCPPSTVDKQAGPGEVAAVDEWGAKEETHYWDSSTFSAEPRRVLEVYSTASIPADGVTQALLQVPEYSGVFVTGPSGLRVELAESDIVFSTPEPGIYSFLFNGVEILPKEVVVHVT